MDDSFYRQLDIGQWAWEFLRRNPEYRADYAQFMADWQALEADYGTPPGRDFFRWKQDPRASRPAWDPSQSTGAACTTDDEDRQLIECWMGAKWGFYQFPQDPDLNALELETLINWRPPPAYDFRSEDVTPGRLRLNFDLALPLAAQLEAARNILAGEQLRLRQSGLALPHTRKNQGGHWHSLLEILDSDDASHPLWNEAEKMTRSGYREMLCLRMNETAGT